MDKYEYNVKSDQIKKLYSRKEFEAAAKIADEIDWYRVKDNAMINRVADIYENTKQYEKAKEILLIAYERSPLGRQLAYKLTILALRTKNFVEADEFYQDFVEMSPSDVSQYLLKYRIAKAKGEDIEVLIKILEAYVDVEMDERWQYELAKLYHEAGRDDKCVSMCDELVLWFNDGKYVDKAKELKRLITGVIEEYNKRYAPERSADSKESIAASNVHTDVFQADMQTADLPKPENQSFVKDEILENETGNLSNENRVTFLEEQNPAEQYAEKPTLEGQTFYNVQPHVETEEERRANEALKAAEEAAVEAQRAAELAKRLVEEARLKADAFKNPAADSENNVSSDDSGKNDRFAGMTVEEIRRKLDEEELQYENSGTEKKASTIEIFEFDKNKEGKGKNIGEELTKTAEIDIDEIKLNLSDSNDLYNTANIQEALAKSMEKLMSVTDNKKTPEIRNAFYEGKTEEITEPISEIEPVKAAEVPKVAEAPKAAEEPKATEVPGTVEEPEAMEAPRTVEEPEATEAPGTVEEPEATEAPRTVEEPEATEAPGTAEEPKTIEVSRAVGESETIEELKVESEEESLPKELELLKEAETEAVLETVESLKETESVTEPETVKETESITELEKAVYAEREQQESEDDNYLDDYVNEPTKRINRDEINRLLNESRNIYQTSPLSQLLSKEENGQAGLNEPMQLDEQIEGQMTIEEVLVEFEKRKADEDKAKLEALAMEAQELANIETEDDMEEIEDISEASKESEAGQSESEADKNEAGQTESSQSEAAVSDNSAKDIGKAEEIEYKSENNCIPENYRNMFNDFVGTGSMEESIAETLDNLINNFAMDGTSKTNNVIITGSAKVGKTTLGLSIIKAANKGRNRSGRKVAKVKASVLNKRGVALAMTQILGTDLIIEQAGNLMPNTVVDLMIAMKNYTEEMLIVLEDDKAAIDRMLENAPDLKTFFTNRLDIHEMEINDMVKIAKEYAADCFYEIDEMGELALYAKLDDISGRNPVLSIEDIQEVVDDAIAHANRFGLGKLFGKLRKGKGEMSTLSEQDFL